MYEARTFTIPELTGISSQTIEEHLGLYAGYVKNTNRILSELATVENTYARSEMQRRLGFEFGGMKNHEAYFAQFEGGAQTLPEGKLHDLITQTYGSLEAYIAFMKNLASTRGAGWAMTYYDARVDGLVSSWIDEQHIGQLTDVTIVLALDMWEHSFMLDYPPSQKTEYIDAFFTNLNWAVVAGRV